MKTLKVFKVSFFCVFIIALTSNIHASSSKPTFGVSLGFNMTDMSGDDVKSSSSEIGFALGGFANYKIAENLSFQPEFYLSFKNCNIEEDFFYNDIYYGPSSVYDVRITNEVDIKLTYLEVPLLAKFEFPVNNNLKPFVIAGPYFAIKIGDSVDSSIHSSAFDQNGNEVLSSDESEDDIDVDFTSTEWGLIFGAGCSFDKYSLQLRYNYGMSDIADDSDVKLEVISVLFSYSMF